MSEQLDLMPLQTSIARPQEPIARGATIEGQYRFDLTRAWGAGPAVCWVMLNPSTADGLKDDPTIWNIMCRSLSWGFGSLVVVNIYPFRSPSPAALKAWLQKDHLDVRMALADNASHAFVLMRLCELVMAAWGSHANPVDVAYVLDQQPSTLHCLGRTKSGAPLHPLARGKHFVPMDRKPVPFSLEHP